MTFPEVQKFVADKLGVNAEQIVPSADLRDDLGADAIDMFELFIALKMQFGVNLNQEAVLQVETVQQLYELIKETVTSIQIEC